MPKPETILIVDDDRLTQATFKLLLEIEGYNVLLAEDGEEALALLEAHEIDVVLLDVLMPNKDGIETLIEMKRRRPRLPVFVVSGGGLRKRHDLLALARSFGADAVLTKPLNAREMIVHLQSMTSHAA
jgi:CheY-like chemotaxis protein